MDAFTWPDYDFMSNNAVPKAPPTSTERNNALIADLRRIPSVQDVEIVTPSEAEVAASLTDSMWRKFFADEDEADAGIKTMVEKDSLDEGDAFVPSNEAPEDRNAVTALGTPDAGLLYLVHDFASYPDWDFKPHYDALARDPYVANIGIGRFRAYSKYRYFFPSPSTNVRAIATNYRDDLRMKASLLFLIIVRAIRLSDSCFVCSTLAVSDQRQARTHRPRRRQLGGLLLQVHARHRRVQPQRGELPSRRQDGFRGRHHRGKLILYSYGQLE